MQVMDFFAAQPRKGSVTQPQSDRNKKARLILLGCYLLAAKMGIRSQSTPLRITTESLTQSYYDEGDSASIGGARKMAARDIQSIRQVFGLEGADVSGYQLGICFQPPRAYLQMFKYWLQWLQQHNNSPDTVLIVMLEGLIAAIESAFTDDPICIPNLARSLQKKYGKSNARDTRKPLHDLFDDRAMAHFLPLENVSETDDSYKVDVRLEPLLMRKRSREKVGANIDDTIILARPGLIRSRAHVIIKQESDSLADKLSLIMEAIEQMALWKTGGERLAIPYSLHFQQATHEFVLVVYWSDRGSYENIPVQSIGKLPCGSETGHYCPSDLNQELWQQWKSLSYWQL